MTGRPEAPPIVIVDRINNSMRLVAMEADQRLAQLVCHQSLGDARAIVPDIDCIPHDAAGLHTMLHALARWCERYTPLVATSGEDGLFLDITGCAHLFGGEHAIAEDLVTRLRAQGFAAQVAIADTPGAAWAFARHDCQRIVSGEKTREVLEALPLAALRLEPDTVGELGRLGLRTIGCVERLPRAPLAKRFGLGILRRLDQAFGREGEAISPLHPAPEFVSEKRFAEPVSLVEDIRRTILLLAQNLKPGLENKGRGARSCALILFRVDGETLSVRVETSAPTRDPLRIARLFEERFEKLNNELDAGFGFDVIRLCVDRSEHHEEVQHDIMDADACQDDVEHLVDRLVARLGKNRVRVFQINDTHVPERRFALVPAGGRLQAAGSAVPAPTETPLTRPLVMLNRPEPAEVIAEVPEGPPIRFRWRKAQYEIIRSEGPERIACEWWRDGRNAHTRDYFCVEDRQGYRFWLFRHGLYERETNAPKWYLHGLFG